MTLDPTIAPAVSAALLRVCARNAFFGALALFARFTTSETVPTAATDGRDVFINTAFFGGLPAAEQEAVLLHEVLHAALLHVPRRGGREPMLWNIAADIVVNGMLVHEGYQLPANIVRDPAREHLSVEEAYELLQRAHEQAPAPSWADLLDAAPDDAGDSNGSTPTDATPSDKRTPSQRAALEQYWQAAQQQARVIAESTQHGTLPAEMERELRATRPAQLDWRALLWRYLVRTPVDFQSFDRRFIGDGMYLDTLDGETLHVAIAVDTSGSIDADALELFLGEVRSVLRAYPHLRCDLYYADAAVYGPYPLTARSPTPTPKGGGGTDFCPFFKRISQRGNRSHPALAVYLTDGYGSFPDTPPHCPTLWVVTPGGLDLGAFPFGEAVRLLKERSAMRG